MSRHVEDGERIAELLASEVAGRERGPLGRVAVVDARADAEPSPEGTVAYALALGAGTDGVRLADVLLLPDRVRIEILAGVPALPPADDRLVVHAGDPPIVEVPSGAAVKPAVDLVVALAGAADG